MSVLLVAAVGVWLGVSNPVLPGTADAGVLRYAGRYYLMGVGTSGGMYRSDDLVHWSGSQHAFSMSNAWATGPAATDDNIHACDMVLRNGVFHLYWSVNRGPLRQIGHATADTPTGPYTEAVRDVPFDGRIDPQCFQDDDGRLFFYSVKFTAGNVIWGQPMAAPSALAGEPVPLLSALSNTWETLDIPAQRVNEGPFVIKYRGLYYLIYNANHTASQFGHYALGVAEADSPLGFSNSGKYGFPVLRSNQDPKYQGEAPRSGVPEVKNAGQPNVIRGPNGIEWWIVYFADRERRAQCLDRVHFFGRELYVEGPTTADTPGYHPSPARPSFVDRFEDEEPLAARWMLDGPWYKKDGVLHVSGDGSAAFARAAMPPSRDYILETVLRYQGGGAGRMGVIAWDNGQGSMAMIGLERATNTAFFAARAGKRTREQRVSLPGDFNWNGPHAMRVENNAGDFRVLLDGVLLAIPKAHLAGGAPGRAGFFAADCSASFEHFSLTRGWDEWGRGIRGWKSRTGHGRSGHSEGMILRPRESVFKGDLLPQYELALQIRTAKEGGIYPVYADDENYLSLCVDAEFTCARTEGKRRGKAIPAHAFAIHARIHRAHEASANGNNLRVVKRNDRVLLFAEGIELGEVAGAWPDSRVGLFAQDGICTFDGLMRYELPAE